MGKTLEWFRRWRVLSWRSVLVALPVVYLLVGFFVVPPIARKLAVDNLRALTGRDVTIDAVRFNPLVLSVTVREFTLPDRSGSTLLAFDELYANLQLSSLFRWAITLEELRLENPFVGLRRFEDGAVNVVELLDEIERRTPSDSEDDVETNEPGGLPRAVLRHILVSGGVIVVDDRVPEVPASIELGPTMLELHDISTIPQRRGNNEFVIGLKEGGALRVSGEVVVEPFGLDGEVLLEHLFLESTWPLLQSYFEIDLEGGKASGRFHYSVQLADEGLRVQIDDLDYQLTELVLEPHQSDDQVLDVAEVAIEEGHFSWPEGEVGAAVVRVKGANAFAWLEPDGSFGWEQLVPKPTQEQVVKTYHEVEEAVAWKATVDRLEIQQTSARFEDRTFDQPVTLAVGSVNLVVTDISTEPGSFWGLHASASLLDAAAATAQGRFSAQPLSLAATVGLKGLDLAALQPYVERNMPLELLAGILAADGKITLELQDGSPAAGFAGDFQIERIDLKETVVGSRFLKWGRVEVHGIDAGSAPLSVAIDEIDIFGAGIEVLVTEDGRINLLSLLTELSGSSEAPDSDPGAERAPTASSPEVPLTVRLGTLTLHECSGAYTDRTLAPAFVLALDQIDGTISGVAPDATAGASIEIAGAVRSGGTLEIDGDLDPFDPGRLTDLSIDLRQLELVPISPMAVRYIGHPIERGSTVLGFKYEIVNNQLSGNNRIVTQDLALGDKVPDQGAIDLPIKLGLSLLTDRNGQMTLEFPIEGSIEDPDFGVGSAMNAAVKEISGELVKSPFRMLGKLGGGKDGGDFRYVEFAAGQADLGDPVADKLRALGDGALQRPGLILQVAGVWDPTVDIPALQESAFDALVAERSADLDDGDARTVELLESLFGEQGEGDRLHSMREALGSATAPDGSEPTIDETAYYLELRKALIEAQPVDEAQLRKLGDSRAQAIRTLWIEQSAIDPERIRLLDSLPVKKPSGEDWVRLELDVDAAP